MATSLPHRAAAAALVVALLSSGVGAIEPVSRKPAHPPRTWYVDNTAAPDGDGSAVAPFDRLARAERAADVGDTIYVFRGDGTARGLGGIRLRAYQRLVGSGAALAVAGDEAFGAGELPLIDGGEGPAVILADHARIEGLELRGGAGAVAGSVVGDVLLAGLRVDGGVLLRDPRGVVRIENAELHGGAGTPALRVDGVSGQGTIELEGVAVTGEGIAARAAGHAVLLLTATGVSFEALPGNAVDLTAEGEGKLRLELAGSGPVGAPAEQAATAVSAVARESGVVEIAARGNDLLARETGLLLSASGRARIDAELTANAIGGAGAARGVVVLLGDHAQGAVTLVGNRLAGQRAEAVHAVAAAQTVLALAARDNDLASGASTGEARYAALLLETRDESRACLALAENRFGDGLGGGPSLALRQRGSSALALAGHEPVLARSEQAVLADANRLGRVEIETENDRPLAAPASLSCPALPPPQPKAVALDPPN